MTTQEYAPKASVASAMLLLLGSICDGVGRGVAPPNFKALASDLLEVTRRTVNRTLKDMREAGTVDFMDDGSFQIDMVAWREAKSVIRPELQAVLKTRYWGIKVLSDNNSVIFGEEAKIIKQNYWPEITKFINRAIKDYSDWSAAELRLLNDMKTPGVLCKGDGQFFERLTIIKIAKHMGRSESTAEKALTKFYRRKIVATVRTKRGLASVRFINFAGDGIGACREFIAKKLHNFKLIISGNWARDLIRRASGRVSSVLEYHPGLKVAQGSEIPPLWPIPDPGAGL